VPSVISSRWRLNAGVCCVWYCAVWWQQMRLVSVLRLVLTWSCLSLVYDERRVQMADYQHQDTATLAVCSSVHWLSAQSLPFLWESIFTFSKNTKVKPVSICRQWPQVSVQLDMPLSHEGTYREASKWHSSTSGCKSLFQTFTLSYLEMPIQR